MNQTRRRAIRGVVGGLHIKELSARKRQMEKRRQKKRVGMGDPSV